MPLSRAQLREAEQAIQRVNAHSDADFVNAFLDQSDAWPLWTHPRTGQSYTLSLVSPGNMPFSHQTADTQPDMQSCFSIVEAMSGPDYRASIAGWHPDAKREEMHSPGLRYILVRPTPDPDSSPSSPDSSDPDARPPVEGFASFMPTFEAGLPVIYCYELQLRPSLQGCGLGRKLMEHIFAVTQKTPALMTMLTCFTHNTSARAFYHRMGFALDDSSPRPRALRSGKPTVDYEILSRPVDPA